MKTCDWAWGKDLEQQHFPTDPQYHRPRVSDVCNLPFAGHSVDEMQSTIFSSLELLELIIGAIKSFECWYFEVNKAKQTMQHRLTRLQLPSSNSKSWLVAKLLIKKIDIIKFLHQGNPDGQEEPKNCQRLQVTRTEWRKSSDLDLGVPEAVFYLSSLKE